MARRPLRMTRRALVISGGVFVLGGGRLLAGLALPGCGEDSTGGKRVTLRNQVTTDLGTDATFTNAMGWTITLTKALLSIGRLAYFEGTPVTGGLRKLLAIPQAHAHPGHYQSGDLIGEMAEPDSVDLLAGMTELATGTGVTGTVRSARYSFHSPPTGAQASELGDNVVVIEGRALSGSDELLFRATAKAQDVLDSDGLPEVTGCVFETADVQSDGLITLTVNPNIWLDQSDFGSVTPSTDGSRVELEPEQGAHKAFVRGLVKAAAYGFSYSAQS